MSQANKDVVKRFNREVIEQGLDASTRELMAVSFINRTAPPGADSGPAGMLHTFNQILRPAISGLEVIIHEQVAEGDLVTTRKTIRGIHSGPLMGVPATGRALQIDAIDIVRVIDGMYVEHWGMNNLSQVVSSLNSP